MLEALTLARLAASHGDVPVGCVVLAADGARLGAGENRREVGADPTAHAELVALRDACRRLGTWRLEGATAVVTLEPCAMCAGALVNARIGRVVYGAPDPKAGALESLYRLGADARLNHRFPTEGGLLADACARELREFFARLRAAGQK
ncbi:MAG: nucleoside deaminase [Polyangiaceae bacterium]|nr:nucleoside deaminase [Polyangiaceae bacterium]